MVRSSFLLDKSYPIFDLNSIEKYLFFKFCGNKLDLVTCDVAVIVVIMLSLKLDHWSMTTRKSMKLYCGVLLSMKVREKIQSGHMLIFELSVHRF